MNTVYNDEQVQGSESGPVVYMRNGTGSPLVGYAGLALRWGLSKSTVGRILNKLTGLDYISLLPFPGRHGSVIYLKSYLSTMFDATDVLIDKDEIALCLNIPISVSEEETADVPTESVIEVYVPETEISVPEWHMKTAVSKTAKVLAAAGFVCCECPHSTYKLLPLSDSKGIVLEYVALPQKKNQEKYLLKIYCKAKKRILAFELTVAPVDGAERKDF